MNSTQHLFSDKIYLVSSSATARNPIFHNDSQSKRFLEKVDLYLGPICKVLHYAVHNCSFQLIVKINSREEICHYYKNQKGERQLQEFEIPFTSYIFSKAMSDLLVSTAKHFNYHNQRKGALFACRFKRKLIETKKELEKIITTLNLMKETEVQLSPWNELPEGYRIKNREPMKLNESRSACKFYLGKKLDCLLSSFMSYKKMDLRGSFSTPHTFSLKSQYSRLNLTIFFSKFPNST
jgi:hypothetical protein